MRSWIDWNRAGRLARHVAAAALLVGPLLAGDARAENFHAETLTSSPRGLQVTQYWSKGKDRMRAETVIAGHRLVTIVNDDLYYSINMTQGNGIAVKRSKRAIADGKKRPRLMGLEAFMIRDRGGEKVSSEVVAGRMCDVYKQTDSGGRREVWVQQVNAEDLLPLRVEFYNRQSAALIRTDYVQWARGLELPDRMFVPDPRFSIDEMDYEEYVARGTAGEMLVPALHGALLHGEK